MKVQVRLGDSFWYYSQIYGLPLQLIIDSNRGLNIQQLQVGSEVNIPGFVIQTYSIKRGDTLWSLARKQNLLPDALFLVNPGINAENVQIGQGILLPTRVTRPIIQTKKNYDYRSLQQDLNSLLEIYPFLRQSIIGHSVLGSSIPEIRIGRGRKKVHLNGSFHANEWITTAIIMKFVNDYLLALTNMSSIRGFYVDPFYYENTLSIVPMLNPDGVDLVLNGPPGEEPHRSSVLEINKGSHDFKDWKANIRGIDLNNQFPANWEIEKERKEPKSPAPRDYPGEAPLTEPEAIAMVELTKKRDFDRVLAFHTQGKEIYWGYEGLEPPEAQVIVNEFARVSGYKAVRYIDSHAGYKDWFIQEYKRPGYTIELGEGVNPLPLTQFDEIYEQSLGISLASMYT
ncbi:M14 family metallopeptidase [Bacillus sp. PS06]|uniref:M14 family metallopeptidase n=1 Tax=Bacillus sp. PS06 TaxID=2764176 RepID=UPI0017832D08|nr:M14 family metallopeptidase [Bacillus sp. PS06]MBD8071349.1 LysM peptidoglycan-binding domain-containing protein [Bacillus sp. PS06]